MTYTRETIIRVMRAAGAAQVPVLLWGPPGVGKSALIESLAEAAKVPCEVVVGSTREPSDFLGLPVVADDGSVRMAPPDWFRRLNAAGKGVLFLDELSCSPPAVQAAMLRVCRERWVGAERLVDPVTIIAAANPPEQAADGWDLAAPAANRFLHLDYRPDTESWVTGMTIGFDHLDATPTPAPVPSPERRRAVRAMVGAFIHRRPELLQSVPTDDQEASRAWPSMRTWTMAADVLAALDDGDTEAATLAVAGLVGDGPATEFLTWRTFGDLPDPARVLAHPTDVDWATERTDRVFATLSAVVAHVAAIATPVAWEQACDLLGVVADAGVADVGAASLRQLLQCRPNGTRLPASLSAGFARVLHDAGLAA